MDGLILSLKVGKPYKKEKILRSLKSMVSIKNRLVHPSPPTSLLKAYRDIFHHMEIIYEISEMNLALGYKTVPLKKFASGIIRVAAL